ncbi:hypothetical protein ACS0TY_012125 [Phlomoides rotata]
MRITTTARSTPPLLLANIVSFFTSKIPSHGWRYSLGIAGVSAIIIGLGSLLIVETLTSLIERGKTEDGLKSLRKIAKSVKHPFRSLMKRSSWPPVFCGTTFQVFQLFTGINVIMFYAPVLFQNMGLGADASLLSAVITGSVNMLSMLVAVFGVDKFGRRKLLIQAALQMFIAQVITGVVLTKFMKATNMIPKTYAYVVIHPIIAGDKDCQIMHIPRFISRLTKGPLAQMKSLTF